MVQLSFPVLGISTTSLLFLNSLCFPCERVSFQPPLRGGDGLPDQCIWWEVMIRCQDITSVPMKTFCIQSPGTSGKLLELQPTGTTGLFCFQLVQDFLQVVHELFPIVQTGLRFFTRVRIFFRSALLQLLQKPFLVARQCDELGFLQRGRD